jgi:hypothetical protein
VSSALDNALVELEHDRHCADEYGPIVKAAGYLPQNIAKLSGVDCYMLATKICGMIREAAQARFRTVDGIFENIDYIACLKSMTFEQLFELRKKIDYKPMRRRG